MASESPREAAISTRTEPHHSLADACRGLAAGIDDADRVEARQVETVLHAIAAAGGTRLSYLDPDGGDPSSADIQRIVANLNTLAGLSWTIASIYLITPVIVGSLIARGGSRQQRVRLLPEVGAGEGKFAFAMTEPGAGSDAAAIRTEARRTSEGWAIRGIKHYITGADSADGLLVVARTGGGRRSFSVLLVPRSTAGLTVEVQPKLAMHGHASCRVVFDEAVVPEDAVLGGVDAVGEAWPLLQYTGSLERTAVAAMATGSAGSILRHCLAFARQRTQFGQPIGSFQSIQHSLVEMASSHRVMELLVEDALALWEAGDDVTRAASTAKYVCAEHLQDMVGRGMRILGGRAFFDHEEMSRLYREAPFALYAGGTNEIQKNLVARSLGLVSQ